MDAFHRDHATHHLAHAAEGDVVDEEQIQIGLAARNGLVNHTTGELGDHAADGVLCIGHLADGIVQLQRTVAIPVLLRNRMPQQGGEGCIRHGVYIAGATAVQQLYLGRVAGGVRIRCTGALDLQCAAQADVLAGRGDQDVIRTALDLELVGLHVEVSCFAN